MDTACFSTIPEPLENILDDKLKDRDINHLAKALLQVVSESWMLIGQFYFNLSPGKIKNIEVDASTRPMQILCMVQAWAEKAQENASFKHVNEILDKAQLLGTKHRFWSCYLDKDCQDKFEKHGKELHDFFHKVVKCPIKEVEWADLLNALDMHEKAQQISESHKHEKIRQRLGILQAWVEKFGYADTTINKLKDHLKSVRLRRVVCQIAGPEDNTVSMNERFIHFLEDEWDYIFLKINAEQRKSVLDAISPDERVDSTDDAFNKVMKRGNAGFHTFIKALADELKEDFSSVIKNKDYMKIFDIRKVYPKAPHFKETEAYEQMKLNINRYRFVELHGLPGSGKSQCASAFAKEFMDKNPLSIVWFLDCKNSQCIDDSMLLLKNALCDAKIHTNGQNQETAVKALVDDIRSSDLYILLILEDLYGKTCTSKKLQKLLLALRPYSKSFVIATTKSSKSTPKGMFHQQQLLGFTDKEALDYLMPDGKDKEGNHYSKEERSAAETVAKRYSNLPLGIAPAKAYCDEKGLSYVDYLEAMDQEREAMEKIETFQDEWIDEYYKTENEQLAGKNILATMVLALSSLKQETLSDRTVSFKEIFSYARYFHHEKIPIYLFKQLVVQPDILNPGVHVPVSDLLCKIALTNMLDQLRESSIGVVDATGKDIYRGTVSTHRVVLFALRCMEERNKEGSESKLLNALYALACYFQKDNRLIRQHDELLKLMPHVASALSNVAKTSGSSSVSLLESMLVIRLFELKGFACTQTDAANEAEDPLNEAYKRLIELLCGAAGIEVDNLDATVQERVLEGNGPDTYLETKARVLNQFCKKVVDKIPAETFDLLVQTVILNQEDVDVLKRSCKSGIDWNKDVKVNAPVTSRTLKILREKKLALSREKLQACYLAEQLASVLYTRGRLMFYDGGTRNNREEKIKDLKLSYYITKEVFKDTGENLLHFFLSDANGLLYLSLNGDKGTDDEKRASFEKAYRKYNAYLNSDKRYYEHGILKEDGKTAYNTMRCYRQMIRANHLSMKLTGNKSDDRFQVCSNLKQLVHDNPQYARTAVDALVVAGDYCSLGGKHELAIEIYREVMDRVRDDEEKYVKNFFKATEGFSRAALDLFKETQSSESRKSCEEARQRCDKALVLVPRVPTQTTIPAIKKELDDELELEGDRKRRKTDG